MKSPFWSYFADTLRLGLIDKPGPLQALAKGLALRLDTVREDAVFMRAQWFPQLCEAELVPAFGASRGLARHHTETAEQFRARVINAYAWHMMGGKQEGLPQILQFYGFDIAEIENMRRYQPSRWAEFQVGLHNPAALADQNAILAGLETLVWLINEYKPARSRLARLYTDIYNVTPLVWSEGTWSNHYYSLFSGVPASVLGPGFAGRGDLILSFGLRYSVETERPEGAGLVVFSGQERTGFTAPYIDSPKWSEFRWSQGFPHKHGFTVGEIYSADWSERVSTSYPWEGAWDDRKWAEFSVWDRLLPQWEMHSRSTSRSQLVYNDPFLGRRSQPRSGFEAMQPGLPDSLRQTSDTVAGAAWDAGRYGGLNANWSVPTAIQVGRPNRWGAFRYSDSTERRRVTIHRQSAERRIFAVPRPVLASGAAALAKGISGGMAAPLHDESWTGAWDDRRWNDYIGYCSIKSEDASGLRP